MPENIIKLTDYQAKPAGKRPREIAFRSPVYWDEHGSERSTTISVRVEDGDVVGILAAVMEDGGVGHTLEDGTFMMIPWPCAVVEIRDL
jgi:hypothetical protein